MNDDLKDVAEKSLRGAESDTMGFPEIVATLVAAGFEGYAIDFRQKTAAYYLPDGTSASFPINEQHKIAKRFNEQGVKAAVLEAQKQVPDYTYNGFCRKVMEAGCAGYIVSFSGRRVLYYGRTAETCVEHFPD